PLLHRRSAEPAGGADRLRAAARAAAEPPPRRGAQRLLGQPDRDLPRPEGAVPRVRPGGPMKRIDRFDPVPGKTRAECDRHYLEIHHAFARNMYRSPEADVQLYVANRALGQYDINGGFDQDPTAWRFVF